jgi:hypothetical protein
VRSWKAAWGGLAVGAVLLGDPGSARAQSCGAHPCSDTISPNVCITGASRTTSRGVTQTDARPAGENPCGINYADCAGDVTLDFALTIDATGADGDALQIWAGPPPTGANGGGCEQVSWRKGSAQACWPLAAPSSNIAATQVTVRAEDIAASLNATTLPTSYSAVHSVRQACQLSQTTPCPIALGIYIMLVKGDDTVDGVPAVYDFQADVLGPHAPSGVTSTINDGYVQIGWTPATDTCIVGYNVYCQNLGMDAAATHVDAAQADTGGNVVDGGTTIEECGDTLFSSADVYTTMSTSSTTTTKTDSATMDAGAGDSDMTTTVTYAGISNLPLDLLCASPNDDLDGAMTSGAAASSATINLHNYDYYVFAVAAVDTSGNVGPIGAPIVCGTPGPIDDFWYNYTNEGGLAGGGYCALEAVGSPAGSALMGLGIAFAGAGLVRRRRGRNKRH